ncbi:MAG TPA: electron transfer flavoprotein subunit alpha/FixB family protein [Syntrophomonadaceae bacterium]|nr:electron transfer flavoprotein subunit alpha/FixB family protein [Syntrophomonadaceae bacterium]HPR94054.1 electron transfer flavoprotein subunit alpha/FixB family protein [Syntrophomonadaceae bacterium]
MSHSIMIMCEQNDGRILPVTDELLACAARIAGCYHSRITAVLPGNITDADAISGVELLVINSPGLAEYTGEGWEKTAILAAGEIKPDIIIIAHTSTGYDYAPRVAARLDGSCITSVSGIEISEGDISYRRGGFHGKLDLLYRAGQRPLIITVLPGAFAPYDQSAAPGMVRYIDTDIHPANISNVHFSSSDQSNTELEHAEVIIAAGKGIGKAENLEMIREMASCFKRSAIAGSRVACDNRWIEYNAQVGLTGKKVAPLLYVACGISGSAQHLAGMKDSKTVVSINRDPEAAIFRHSDICIVEELEKFIPEFIREAEKHRV